MKHYELVLKKETAHIQANSRLMMLYWKLREFSKEVKLIKEAVETEAQQQRYIDEHPEKVRDSKALAQSLGLLSTKGYPLTENQAILKWQERLLVAQKKLERIKSETRLDTKPFRVLRVPNTSPIVLRKYT